MARARYEGVGSTEVRKGSNFCLKFWLSFFILSTLALIGVTLWLVVVPKYAASSNAHTPKKEDDVDTLKGASWVGQPGLCALPPAQGSCEATIERYYYDTTSGTCRKFIYGGCSGNTNNFATMQQCMEVCVSPRRPQKPEFCLLEKEPGMCFALLKRYAYDKKLDRCVEFIFSGCGGNQNNFETIDECETQCMGQTKSSNGPLTAPPSSVADTSVCNLPFEKGHCADESERWGFDANIGQCILFVYGGCGGNGNNFKTKEDCEMRCRANIPMPLNHTNVDPTDSICLLRQDVGPCRMSLRKWAFDALKGECVEFIYGGCRGNANNFDSKEDCEAKCRSSYDSNPEPPSNFESSVINSTVCSLPQERGDCVEFIPRWSYDSTKRKCLQFAYSGCGGNANNFDSMEACEMRCLATIPMPLPYANIDDICKLPHEVGPCLAAQLRWAFDAASGICVEFIYGGCGGNDNNFVSKAACEAKCGTTTPLASPNTTNSILNPVCKLPQEVGPCRAMIKRWSYDTSKDSCVEFFYGGCRGNANNFESKQSCEDKCRFYDSNPNLQPDICTLPKKPGPCRGRNKRYYYEPETGECMEFNYGGCRGNENNFWTREECEMRCMNPA